MNPHAISQRYLRDATTARRGQMAFEVSEFARPSAWSRPLWIAAEFAVVFGAVIVVLMMIGRVR